MVMPSTENRRALRRRGAMAMLAAFGWLSSAAVSEHAQAANSPFLPPGFGGAEAPPPAATGPLDSVEFRGVLSLEGKTYVTLFDTGGSRSFTALVGETVNNVKVVEYKLDGQDDIVTIESGGKTRRVPLKKAKIVAMATPPPTAVPLPPGQLPTGQQPGTIAQPLGGSPNMPQLSDEEVRQRMQRVAEEIRRRRAVRREMLENSQTPGPQ